MAQMRMSTQFQQMLAIGMPLGALALCLFVVYPTWVHYGELRRQVAQRRNELIELKSAPLPPQDPILPAAEDVPDESARFLGEITNLANASRCEVADLTVIPSEPFKGLVRPKRVQLRVRARYPAVRALLWRLKNAPRHLTVVQLGLQAEGAVSQQPQSAGLIADLTIERYVAAPAEAVSTSSETAKL